MLLQVTIHGGHKARFPYQGIGTDFAGEATAIDHPLCAHVPLEPGDVIMCVRPGSVKVGCASLTEAVWVARSFNARSTPHGVLAWNGESERRCVIQFNNPRNAALTSGQLLGSAARNEVLVNGGAQKPPGWDLNEAGFEDMMRDLGLGSAEEYIEYKRGVGFGDHVAKPRL